MPAGPLRDSEASIILQETTILSTSALKPTRPAIFKDGWPRYGEGLFNHGEKKALEIILPDNNRKREVELVQRTTFPADVIS